MRWSAPARTWPGPGAERRPFVMRGPAASSLLGDLLGRVERRLRRNHCTHPARGGVIDLELRPQRLVSHGEHRVPDVLLKAGRVARGGHPADLPTAVIDGEEVDHLVVDVASERIALDVHTDQLL